MSKIYEVVRPRSLSNSDYEEFEYVIRWIGRDGSEYLHMFYNARIKHKIRGSIVNQDDSDLIESIISESGKSIELFADDLSKNDLNVMLEMFENKHVTRLKKDGTIERYGLDENSLDYKLIDGRYELSVSLIAANRKVWS